MTQVAAPSAEVDFFSASIWKIVLGDFVSPSGSLVAKKIIRKYELLVLVD